MSEGEDLLERLEEEVEREARVLRRILKEGVKWVRERFPEVKISSGDYAAMYAVFRQKKKVPEEERRRAYEKWDQVFSPGRKVVSVEGQPA